MRPANLVTAVADILAGASVAAAVGSGSADLPWLCLATVGLYGGGVVFNDVFDVDLDRLERPERALPSGQVSLGSAILLGGLLLFLGSIISALVSGTSGAIAVVIACLVLVYDAKAKHHKLFGPLVMGMCRGGNLLLGISLSVVALQLYWWLGIIPIIFIAAITLTSRGEVHGRNRKALKLALALDVLVATIMLCLAKFTVAQFWPALPFLLLWFGLNARAKLAALTDNRPERIKKAVKTGVVSLIPLNACLAAGFLGVGAGLAVLLLLPLSIWLGRFFAVT